IAALDSGPQCQSNMVKCRVGTSSLLNQFDPVCIQLQPHSSAADESRVKSQKENIRKHAPLYFHPTRKRLIAREEGNRASCPEVALKPPLFFAFPSSGVANIDRNHVPLEHYIGQFTAGNVMLFYHDIVPFCANARENNPRRNIAGQEFSVCAPERNTVRVLHCKSLLHRESA